MNAVRAAIRFDRQNEKRSLKLGWRFGFHAGAIREVRRKCEKARSLCIDIAELYDRTR
jgi:hypothetical protein